MSSITTTEANALQERLNGLQKQLGEYKAQQFELPKEHERQKERAQNAIKRAEARLEAANVALQQAYDDANAVSAQELVMRQAFRANIDSDVSKLKEEINLVRMQLDHVLKAWLNTNMTY